MRDESRIPKCAAPQPPLLQEPFWMGDWRVGIAEERVAMAEDRLARAEAQVLRLMAGGQ